MSITSDFWKAMNNSGTKVSGGSGGSSQKSSSGSSSGGSFIAPTSTKKKKSISEEFWEALGDDDIAPVSSVASRVQARSTGGRFNADLAPVSKSSGRKKDKEKGKLFQKGLFEDGYNIGDITKTILGTAGDVAIGAVKGFTSGVEGIVDLGSYGVAGVLDAVGKDNDADRLRKVTAESQTDQLWGGLESTAEKYSVLGDKVDSVIDPITQALGYIGMMYATAGIGAAAGVSGTGATALSTGTMFASSAGGSMGEAYQGGATDEGALKHGAMKGAVDAGSELIFGGLGKAAKTLGLSRGLSSLDDIFAKKLSDKISNHFWKSAVQYGVKASAEGVEEVLAGLGSAVSKKLTYMSDEELSKLIKDENLLEQFAVGTAASAIMQSGFVPGTSDGSLKESVTTGRDFISGLSQSEQKVVDKLYQDEIASREKNGNVTQKEKDKIYDSILADMKKGYISTDTIEEVLGGESYSAYKKTVDTEDAILKEYDELGEKQNATPKDYARYTELTEKVKDIHSNSQRNTLRAKLNEDVMGLVQGSRLAESYNERARTGQKFEADVTKYNAKQQAVVQKAIDSGILNNSNRTHEFVDFVSKISADTGVLFDFSNTQKLREAGYVMEGQTIDGFYNPKEGITVNIDSPKSRQFVVGHEITHALEGSELYDTLRQTVFDYAKMKNQYDSRMESIQKRYKEGTDFEAELTADLVGEYIFSDTDFVKHLSTQNRNVFQKVYDEIKYLCKVATAGSKEARELEKVKRAFEKVYREGGGGLSDTKYSISSEGKELTKEQQEFFKDSKVRDENGSLKVMYHGTPNGDFTVFKDGTYFTDSKEYADKYQNPGASSISTGKVASNPKTFEVYLDIKKPFDISNAEARSIYINDYIKGGNAMGINPYLSDAEYDKINSIDWTEGEDLREFLIENEYDYDGLVLDEGGTGGYGDEVQSRGKSYVVFSPEQVKNTDNLKPTADSDIRFSLSNPVEETKDLIAVHNLHSAELIETLKLSGLPSPSVAIIKAKDGHDKYGDVSLILPKETIDPQTNKANRIYGSDAWTPTRSNAQVEYEVDYDIQRQFERTIEELSKNVANGVFSKSSVLGMSGIEDSTGLNLNEIAKKISDYDAVQAAYVAENGGNVDVVYRTKEFDTYGNDALKGYIDKVGEQEVARLTAKMMTGERPTAEEIETAKDAIVDNWIEKKAYTLRQKPELREIRISRFRERLTNMRVEDFVRHAWEFYEDSGATTDEVDRGETGNNLRAAVNRADVEAWVTEKLQGLLSEPGIYNGKEIYTPSGKRRSFKETHWDYTAENIVRAMNNADARGANVWNVSGEAIIATATQEYKNIDEVRADKGRLFNAEYDDYEKIKDGISAELEKVTKDIIRTTEHISDNQYDEEQIIGRAIMEAAQSTKNVAGVKRVFQKNGYRIGEAQAKAVLSLFDHASSVPTGYFEAKPQRVVGFDEVGVYVIPYDADVKLKQELLNKGYSIAEYDPKVEGDRTRVLNQFEEYKFSLSNVGEQHTPDSLSALKLGTAEESPVVAPVAENATVQEKTQLTEENATDITAADMQELFPDDAVPVQAELEQLVYERDQIYSALEDAVNLGSANDVGRLAAEYEEINSRIKALESEESERTGSLTDADTPEEMDAPFSLDSKNYDPFEGITEADISRSTRSYSDRNPGARRFLEEAALGFGYDVNNSTRGERWYNDQLYYESGGEQGFGGTARHTTPDIADLKDTYGYTWDDLRKAADDVANGDFRSVAAKRVEYLCHKRLMEGYTDVDGRRYEPNQEYITFLNETFANEQRSESFDSLLAEQSAPEDIAPLKPAPTKLKDIYVDAAPIFEENGGQTTMFDPPKPNPKVANVLTEETAIAKEKSGIGSKLVSALVDKGMVFENLSLKTGNHELQAKWNYTLPSNTEARAQHFMENGADGVKPLKDIKNAVDKSGKADDFFNYLYHVHNIDRMTLYERFGVENKTVFGETVTADVSRRKVAQYEKKNPEFKTWANDVYAYNRHLRQLLVNGNVISQETADLWEQMYPHYVPIRRVDSKGNNISVPLDTNKTGVNNPIKRATGGSSDIQPVFSTMAQRTEQTYRAIARNSFGIELKNTLGSTINSQKNTTGVDETVDTLVAQEDHLLKPGTMTSNPTFTVFENGEKVEFEITEDMFDALKPAGKVLGHRSKVVTSVSEGRRNLLTTWNPVFALYRNPIKDLQDVGVNSQHPVKTYANVPNAIYQIATGGKWATEYAENGGKSNTYFDSRTNKFKAEDSVFKKTIGMPLKALENAGEFIEEIPRLAEYIASRKDGRSVERSMLDAARVTTNFAAGGDFTKFLNSHGFTFLNASVQGASQHVRNFREAKQQGLKGYVKVLAKYTVAGLPGILLNNLLWGDDEEYEELNDYVKQNYYVVAKTEDGKFIRIPKGRTAAVMQNAFEQMEHLVTGDDEADFGTFYELFMNNIAPNNPIENNILAPIWQAKNNEAWYGGDLVPSRLQKLPAEEQFDESTDSISKWMGEKTGLSPYKINYLIDQYSGGVGDMILPKLTLEAESGDNSVMGNILAPWKKEITTDSVLNNRNPGNFYELRDELEVKSNSKDATEEDKMRDMYLDSVSWEMSDLYAKKREIQNSDLPDDEKYEAVRQTQEQINEIANNALNNYNHVRINGLYSEAGDRRYNKDAESGKWYEIKPKNADGSDNWYYQKEQEVTKGLGISYEEYWNNREEYNYAYDKPGKYAVAKAVGGYDSYMQHYDVLENWQSDNYLAADKDSKGNSISGSRKEKVIDYINGLELDYGEKIILYRTVYSSKSDKRTYNQEIINYLNGRDDISYQDMKSILEELDMEVDSEGNISW
jgi:hypothetical protein